MKFSVCLDCIGDEKILHFTEKMVGPTVLFMHFLILLIFSVCLDCIGDEKILHFAEKMVGPTVLFMHFLILLIDLTILFQLTFIFIYSTLSNKFLISTK